MAAPISWGEAMLAGRGVLRLLRFDAGFVAYFDLSLAGARRSFRLAWLLLPAGLLIVLRGLAAPPDETLVEGWALYLAALVYYALAWILFPLALLRVAPALDRVREAPGAIAVYNWFGSAITLVFAIFKIFDAPDLVFDIVFWASFPVEAFAFRYLLRLPMGMIALLVLGDFFLGRLAVLAFAIMAFQ